MSDEQPRSPGQRKADTLAKLTAPAADAWVATAAADADGQARSHLVPLSLAWIDELAGGRRTAGADVDARWNLDHLTLAAAGVSRLRPGPPV